MTLELPGYPGRGVALHRHADGGLEWIYFLTGRSDASRRRVLHAEADRVLVVPTDEAAAPDPLRHYACVRLVDARLVIGNGDHVDQLADALAAGTPLDVAATTIDPEPDAPIFTPRIAVIAPSTVDPGTVDVVAVRTGAGGADDVERHVTTMSLNLGDGVLIHTYGGGIDAVTSDASPHPFAAGPPGTDVAGRLWHALDPGLRVALAVGLVPSPIPERTLTERQS